MADQFTVNGADYTSAADALAAAVPDASGNISITAINGDLTLDSSVAATGKVILRVASADALIAGEDVSSTITITSDFASKLDMQVGTDSENENLQGCTGENAPYRIIFDGANVTGAAGFYSYNYGCVELKNGAQYLGAGSDSHVRGSVLVTGEGTLLSAAFLSVYAADFGSTKPYAASMVVKDGATLFATTDRTDANTFKIGHASKAYRGGELIIEGGIVKSNTDIVVNAGGTISLSNSTVNGKVNYGQIILTEKYASKLVTTNAAAGAVTISLKSTDYANCDASYKIIDIQNTTALDLSKVTITLDGAAYTLGTTFADCYSINQVDNDLVLTYTPPPPLTVSANGSAVGSYESLTAALAAINADAGTGPYTINFSRDLDVSATEKTRLDILKDVIFSGTAVYKTGTNCYLGSSDAGVNLTIAAGSDIELILSGEANLNARYSSTKTSTLTVDNARFRLSSYMSANGLITVKGDATSSDYGFKKGDEYVANFETRQITAYDKYREVNGVGLELTDRAYLRIAGGDNTGVGEFLRWKGDADTTVNITDSKLVAGSFSFAGSGKKHTLNIAGDSVVNVRYVGYDASVNTVSAGTATINVTGMDSEISFDQISSAVTAINFTLTSAEIFSAGMVEAGDNVELLTLNNADAALDAATVLSITLDGAAYTLGDEIVDDAGNKYVIKMGDANGDSVENDLVIEMTVCKPDLSKSDVYVGNLTGKDGVAVHDTANKLTVFESDGTMSEGAVWGLGDWDMLDVADVNGDGADDILISYQHDNGVTGVAALINQQDGSYGMVHQDIRGWSNDLWEYLCSADVNGDGTEDILTIETDSIAAGRDKNVNAWIMDSTGQYSEDMRICGKNTDWEIEGFGDVTGDGKADGILRFKKLVAFWEHDGKNDSVLKEVGQMSTSWKVIGSDDFTGDGLADILFGNSSAQYKLWTDIDEKSYTEINLGTMKNSSLELAGIGDFNGDGKADILWQAADGGLHWGEAESGKLNNLTTIA